MTDVVPAWVLIVATVAGMVTSVLMAWAAVRAQVVQPIVAAIVREVIDALKPDIVRWDGAEEAAAAAARAAADNASSIGYIREAVDDIRQQVASHGPLDEQVADIREQVASLASAVQTHGDRGNTRHAGIDARFDTLESQMDEMSRKMSAQHAQIAGAAD